MAFHWRCIGAPRPRRAVKLRARNERGLVSPSGTSVGCSLSGSDSFRSPYTPVHRTLLLLLRAKPTYTNSQHPVHLLLPFLLCSYFSLLLFNHLALNFVAPTNSREKRANNFFPELGIWQSRKSPILLCIQISHSLFRRFVVAGIVQQYYKLKDILVVK